MVHISFRSKGPTVARSLLCPPLVHRRLDPPFGDPPPLFPPTGESLKIPGPSSAQKASANPCKRTRINMAWAGRTFGNQ